MTGFYEKEIVKKVQNGDIGAFELLVKDNKKKVYNLALRVTGNRSSAADMTQEIFIRVFRSLRSFSGESRFSVWFYRIVCDVCLDYLGVYGKRQSDLLISDETLILRLSDITEFDIEISVTPDSVRRGIDSLSEDYRLILLLREVADLGYGEICEVLELKRAEVKSRLYNARKLLCAYILNNANVTDKVCAENDECLNIGVKISCLADGKLRAEYREEVERHMESCPECEKLYKAFCAISVMMSRDTEEPPDSLFSNVMKAVRSGANLNKEDKQTKRKNNLLAACACALLVVCLCISKGIFGTEENEALKNETDSENTAISDITPIENLYGDSNAEATKKPSGHKAQTASFTDVYGTVYETDNAALIAELENLLAPAKNSEFAPKEYPTYQLVMDYGDSYLSMDIYVESELVFADKGEGPYPVTGDADEFNTLIKNVGQG